MEKRPAPRRRKEREGDVAISREQAVQFLLNSVNATIYSSGDDYEGALAQFFPQLQALGHLIGAGSLDEVSAFLRRKCNPFWY